MKMYSVFSLNLDPGLKRVELEKKSLSGYYFWDRFYFDEKKGNTNEVLPLK